MAEFLIDHGDLEVLSTRCTTLADRCRVNFSEAAETMSRYESAVAEARRARGYTLTLRLSIEPWTHFARLTGEVGGSAVRALVRHDGSVCGGPEWLQLAGVEAERSSGGVRTEDPLTRTLSLSRACDRLLSLELVDVGRSNVSIAGGSNCHFDVNRDENAPESEDEALRIRIDQDGAGSRLVLSGELDVSTAPKLLTCLQDLHAQYPCDLAVDLSELDFIDSIGLSLLVTMHKRAQSEGKRLVLAFPSPQFRRVIEVTGLTDYFDFDGLAPGWDG
jgi:anti-sigma B factor antagonist